MFDIVKIRFKFAFYPRITAKNEAQLRDCFVMNLLLKSGLPDACHIKQASGSSLPVPIFIGRWTDHINLQAEVTESGIKLFSHMAGHEFRSQHQRRISSV